MSVIPSVASEGKGSSGSPGSAVNGAGLSLLTVCPWGGGQALGGSGGARALPELGLERSGESEPEQNLCSCAFPGVSASLTKVSVTWHRIQESSRHGGASVSDMQRCCGVSAPNQRLKAPRHLTRLPVNGELCLSPASYPAAKAREKLLVEAIKKNKLKGYIGTFCLTVEVNLCSYSSPSAL